MTHYGPAASRSRASRALVLLVPALTFGVLVGAQLRSLSDRPALSTRYQLTLLEAVKNLETEQAVLQTQLVGLRAGLDVIQHSAARVDAATAAVVAQVEELKRVAGLTEEQGDGVRVVIDDARLPANSPAIERGIIHAQDLTDLFNAAWRGGARAISVNGERIVGSSACVGATIQINGVLMSPPFEFAIIGSTDALLQSFGGRDLAGLRLRRDLLGLRFDVLPASALVVPAYAGPMNIRYASAK